jgi:hypothetical protein
MDYSPLYDACWSSPGVKSKAMLPLTAALKHWRTWDQPRIKRAVEQIAIHTVRQIIAEMDYLPDESRTKCRQAFDTKTALEAAQAACDLPAILECTVRKRGQHGPTGQAPCTATSQAAMEASWAAAEAGWGAKRAGEATGSAARAAVFAAEAALGAGRNPDHVLCTACTLWIEAANC